MKKYKMLKTTTVCGCMLLASALTSCTDWLTLYPMDKIVEENFWEDKRDLESVRNAAYVNMTNSACLERYMIWGEMRSDNFEEKTGASLSQDLRDIFEANLKPQNSYFDWSKFYETINYCNKVLQHGPDILQKDKSFSESEWENMRAEMVALRSLNYFYLIRAFDKVPMVFSAINDDTEVKAMAATPQDELLDSLVNQLERIVAIDKMPKNYGNTMDNKGLITDKAVHTILADIYLWRASYHHLTDPEKANASYQACINHCDAVIQLFNDDYENNKHNNSNSSVTEEENPYHLVWNSGTDGAGLNESNAYNEIFGSGNSFESIFELQFNGSDAPNALISTYYTNSDGAGAFYPTDQAIAQPAADGGSALFSKTDLRRWTTIQQLQGGTNYSIVKYAANTIDQPSISDNTDITADDKKPKYSIRSSNEANWIFYRLPDVLLMKAEAMCELKLDAKEINELLNAVFKRSNPKATEEELLPVQDAYDKLELQILRERNREFFGEGKRWFDLMRYAMRHEDGPLAAYELIKHKYESLTNGGGTAVEVKFKQGMQMMYSPYTEREIKANPLLEQNPVWDTQSSIQKK